MLHPLPRFGISPEALLQGFATIAGNGGPCRQLHTTALGRTRKTTTPKIFITVSWCQDFGWMRTLYQGCFHAVRKKLRDIKPDIVHGQGTERDCE